MKIKEKSVFLSYPFPLSLKLYLSFHLKFVWIDLFMYINSNLPYRGKLRREKFSSLDQNFITAPLKSSFEIFRRGKLFVT